MAKSSLPFVKRVWTSFLASSGLEPTLIPHLQIIDATPGRVFMELNVEKPHTVRNPILVSSPGNRLSILHGGTIASIVDLAGSLAIASRGMFATGVSTDLNVTYLSSGGAVGEKIYIESRCHKMGRSLAFTTISFFKDARNSVPASHSHPWHSGQPAHRELFARGTHTKYIANALKDPQNELEKYRH
ncbi:uncharacterized protein V1516DRAFT_663151 [Lipomyces oligophaga]|uniref:uncharacterized protein n=1 Tax=Lipomyces oligophaga TaxID=45792 RepID=UPI0034CFC84D